jgi:propionate catabolism operon transcriptional regulator
LPPLRERQADIMPLAAELLYQAARREPRLAAHIGSAAQAAGVLAAAREPLCRHPWPGNVRELQNVIERVAVELAESGEGSALMLSVDVLRAIAPELFDDTAHTAGALTLRQRSRRVEADEIRAALDACGGDRDRVCEMLGISKTTLWRKLNATA